MTFRLPIVISCVLAILCGLGSAAASPIVNHSFMGTVTTGTSFIPSVPVGTQVLFTIPFDFGASDSCALANRGLYFFPGSTVSYDDVSYMSASTALEVNNPNGNCIAGATPYSYTIRMLNFTGAPFSSALIDLGGVPLMMGDQIPHFPLGVDGGFSLSYVFAGGPAAIGNAALVSVPEPALLSLIVAAASAMAVRRQIRCRPGLRANRRADW